ncbi:MAG TPA: tetratricopeptide repeat protein [Pyrinomonadaceae bacterium]|jgi:tetratricopeptide (TPR) repeat protein|nr:tetratricopeptide repeat protein [Pyrinomonadaceae bacterium]
MNSECRGYLYYPIFLCLILAAVVSLAGCTNPEKAKAEHLSKGEAYLKDQKFQEASLEFRSALQFDDKFAAAHWGLARAFEGLNRFQEMLAELQRAVELDANNLEARNKLGNYYLAASRGKPEVISMAEKMAQEVLQKDPNNIEGHILMGSVLFAKNDKEKAFAELNHAIELDPNRVESYLSLAKFYIVTRETAKAEETFKRAISINQNSALAHSEYGKFLVQTNRPQEAEAELKKAVEVAPNDRPSRFVLASFYLVNKQLDKAEEAYKALAALDPGKPESEATLADFYSAINRTDEAIKIYQDIVTKAPDFMQGRYRLTEILLARGDIQGATAQIDEALKKDKTDRQALLLRARVRAQGGQNDGLKAAVEDLKEVLRQEPNSRPGLYFMAQANFSLGLTDQARAFAGDLEKNYPDYLPAKLMNLQITLASGDAKTATTLATDLLDRLSKAAPDRDQSPQLLAELQERTLLARGSAQMQLRNFTGARQDFEAARNIAPGDPNPYNSLALLSLAENKPDEAIADWESALKNDATNFIALNGLTTHYAAKQEFDKAHSRIDQALAAYPNNAPLHFVKANVYGFQHNGQGAEAELRKALELDPNYVAAYHALGALFINSQQVDRAIAEFRKIIEKRPDDQTAYTMIGMLEDARKNYDAAVENYKKALEHDPNAPIAANNLAWLYAVTGKGNLDEAVKLAQGVVQRNPNIAGFVDTLGWVYYKKALYAAAAEQLQKAVSLDEQAAKNAKTNPSANYHYHLGMALKEKGDAQGAKRELEASIRLAEKAPFADIDEAKKALTSL